MTNGELHPSEVIEGSQLTVVCDKEFRTEGDWVLTCTNGTWGDESSDNFPRCVAMKPGT